ncbi:integrin beta pat-3-like [Vanessa cardui]|uniref:integrin beta pat-3-like n=1 Tax=Vanessa cardui TaxID=171605 RepID=UPI001F142980|nr:integrin beta pat-3-like [Vanessa cardui]
MAVVRFSVIVLLLVQQVFAVYRDCSDFDSLKNCNECIRCGGHWCNDPNEEKRCTAMRYDNWCPGQQEKLMFLTNVDEDGTSIQPKYRLRTLTIGMDDRFDISYPSKSKEPKVVIVVNTTQTSNFQVDNKTSCYDSTCTTTIKANPETNFCTANGGVSEYFNVKLSVEGIKEEAVTKFHVPCACACSAKVEERSPVCNGRGSLSCGVCTCNEGWKGAFCETPICEVKRGDVPCTDSGRDNIECSGNGVCGPCDKCECFTDREGSRYFDRDNYCADICMTINDCDDCFLSPAPGRCNTCHFALFRQNYNETFMTLKDDFNRHLWVRCNGTINECNYEYAAMRDENDETFFMVTKSCDPVQERQAGAVSLTLPIVLGVIALVVAAAATVGYMMWKNRPPPVPLADPMYQNIDAEDCTGENPLYKPPTSSFKNPTYGKW